MQRRDLLLFASCASIIPNYSYTQPTTSIIPNWMGFGLNVSASKERVRFPISMPLMSSRKVGKKSNFQSELNEAIAQQLRLAGNFVTFQPVNNFDENWMLAAALDYENVLEVKLGTTSFIILHLIGHGMLLNFTGNRGWRLQSSFPFPVTLIRERHNGTLSDEVNKYIVEAYTDNQNSFATSFAKFAKRLAPKWKDAVTGQQGFNIRVIQSSIALEVQAKLKEWGISGNLNADWLGHLTSAAMCEGLEVPVVPFAETKSLNDFNYLFVNRLEAEKVTLPNISDIDIRVNVAFSKISREIKYRTQLQRWEVIRIIVIDLQVLNDRDDEIVSVRLGYQDPQPDVLSQEVDNSPSRDAHFYDMAIYRGLNSLFYGIDKEDHELLAKIYVKPDNKQLHGFNKFRSIYRRAFEKKV
jgi:hypothetical protein